jgi:hypothetical protein
MPYKEWYKRSFSYWPTAVGRGILDRRLKSPISSGFFGPHAAWCAFHKLLLLLFKLFIPVLQFKKYNIITVLLYTKYYTRQYKGLVGRQA